MDVAILFSAADAKGYCAGIIYMFDNDSCSCGLYFLENVARKKGFDFNTSAGPGSLLALASHIIHFRKWGDAMSFIQIAEETIAKDFHDTNAFSRVLLGNRHQKYEMQNLSCENVIALAEREALNNLANVQSIAPARTDSRI